MKKFMLLAASGALLIGMSSCKKEYTCDCKTTESYTSSDPEWEAFLPGDVTTSTSTTSKMKKKESEDWCKGLENETTVSQSQTIGFGESVTFTGTSKTTCSL